MMWQVMYVGTAYVVVSRARCGKNFFADAPALKKNGFSCGGEQGAYEPNGCECSMCNRNERKLHAHSCGEVREDEGEESEKKSDVFFFSLPYHAPSLAQLRSIILREI